MSANEVSDDMPKDMFRDNSVAEESGFNAEADPVPEFTAEDKRFMELALSHAGAAADIGETPVGAVLVRGGEVIAAAHNLRESSKNPLAHAEILCINEASEKLGGWRLFGCTLYVTLEPCPMCAGAVINSRIDRVVFGAKDAKAGSFGSVVDLSRYPYNHHPVIEGGLMEKESLSLLRKFFVKLREQKKKKQLRNAPDSSVV